MRDLKIEQLLEAGRYAYRFEPQFPIPNIDLATSRANPARLHRQIDDERCIEMALAMERGTDFPAVVLLQGPKSVEVVTGMHRLIAATEIAKPTLKAFDAYLIVEADAYRRDLLIRSINSCEGQRQSRAENLAHCIDLHREYGRDIEDLAISFNLKPSAIKDAIRFNRFDERAKECGIEDLIANIPQRLKVTLSLIKIDALFTETIRVLNATGANGPGAKQLVQDVNSARSVNAAYKILENKRAEFEAEQENAKAKFGKRRPDIPTKSLAAVRRILNLPNAHDPARLQFGALQAPQLVREMTNIDTVVGYLLGWKREMAAVLKQQEKATGWKTPRDGDRPSDSTSPLI